MARGKDILRDRVLSIIVVVIFLIFAVWMIFYVYGR
jgi:hypothetical protein